MQSRTGFSGCDFRCKCNIITIFISQIANDPFGNHQLVGSIFSPNRQKFNFILFVYHSVQGEIAYFGMSVFDLSAGLCNISHALCAEIIKFSIGGRLMVAFLVGCRKHSTIRGNYIIFQFSHCLKLHTGDIGKSFACFLQCMFRRAFQWFAIFIKERAKHGKSWNFGKWIKESRAETWNYIKVATSGFYKGKEAGTVYSFATCKNGIQISKVVNYKIKSF